MTAAPERPLPPKPFRETCKNGHSNTKDEDWYWNKDENRRNGGRWECRHCHRLRVNRASAVARAKGRRWDQRPENAKRWASIQYNNNVRVLRRRRQARIDALDAQIEAWEKQYATA